MVPNWTENTQHRTEVIIRRNVDGTKTYRVVPVDVREERGVTIVSGVEVGQNEVIEHVHTYEAPPLVERLNRHERRKQLAQLRRERKRHEHENHQ